MLRLSVAEYIGCSQPHKNNLFCHLLFDENINIKKRLFMTATERMYKGDIDKDQVLKLGDKSNMLKHSMSLNLTKLIHSHKHSKRIKDQPCCNHSDHSSSGGPDPNHTNF